MPHKKIGFAIVGQPKSGTTALAQFLAEHPQVCMSRPKEPGYFMTDFTEESDGFHGKAKYFPVRTAEDYDKRFSHSSPGQLLGEATVNYLYSEAAAKNIYAHNPSAKIIIILRHPVDFIHSLHMQYVNGDREDEADFARALRLEEERRQGKYISPKIPCPSFQLYTERAKYYEQVKRFTDTFPAKNVLVLTNEEFKTDNAATFKKVLAFLDVDGSFNPDFKPVKASQTPRLKQLNRLVRTPAAVRLSHQLLPPKVYEKISQAIRDFTLKEQSRPPMDGALRQELEKQFAPNVQKTGHLVGRDLAKEWRFGN